MLSAVGIQGLQLKPVSIAVLSMFGSAIDLAVSILQKYNGSLWVADPAYTFTGSDGTGAAGDGSDTGYVRDLCGNARPLTQSTSGFKPKLKRVPKKLGPELVTNGDFTSNISGWTIGTGLSAVWASGAANVSRYGSIFGTAAFNQAVSAMVGKYYQIGYSNTGASSARNYVGTSSSGSNVDTTGNFSLITQATSTAIVLNYWPSADGATITLDNISVREVLEWTWAWVFDGVDDRLATVSLPTADAETIIAAGQFLNTSAVTQGLISKRNSNFGLMIRRETTLNSTGYAMTGAALESAVLDNATYATTKRVYAIAAASGNKRYRRDGAQVNTTTGAYTSNASILSIGAEISSSYAACSVFAAAYAPAALSDAELLVIEKAMAELAGITI